MSKTRKRSLIRTVVLAVAGAAIAVAAGVASAHSSPAAHHALADGGVISAN